MPSTQIDTTVLPLTLDEGLELPPGLEQVPPLGFEGFLPRPAPDGSAPAAAGTGPALDPGMSSVEKDPVLATAGDRPGPGESSLPNLPDLTAPRVLDDELARRKADVDEKHQRIAAWLDERKLDAVVLSRADSLAWFSSGGELGQTQATDHGSVLFYITRNCRAVIADNVQTARVFEEELAGLGFQLKERPWHADPVRFVAELGHNKKVVTDNGLPPYPNELARLKPLRWELTRLERQRLRELGRTMTLAVESTCRNFLPGETEADVAGHLAHRLIREGVTPVELRVAGDGRLDRYRQPLYKNVPIDRHAVITATGRRFGLCATVTRIVAFGKVEEELKVAHALATMVDATYIYFSKPGEAVSEVYRRAKRIYEKFGHPDEWMADYQGYLVGYTPRELLLQPDASLLLQANMALTWSPSVGPARSEDTMVVDARGGFEVVTEAQNWPKHDVLVKGYALPRPGILER